MGLLECDQPAGACRVFPRAEQERAACGRVRVDSSRAYETCRIPQSWMIDTMRYVDASPAPFSFPVYAHQPAALRRTAPHRAGETDQRRAVQMQHVRQLPAARDGFHLPDALRSEEHTSELQSRLHLV